MGHVTSSIVTAVKEADAPCDAPLIAPMAMFHNKDVQEAGEHLKHT